MSQTIVERLGELYSEWAQGNFRGGASLIAPETVVEPPLAAGESRLRGPEEIRAYLRALLGEWDELRVEAREIVDGERATVVSERHRGRRAGDRSETELRFYAVWTFAGDWATRVRWESDRARALELAGVREHSETWRRDYSSTSGLPFDDVELESRIVWIWGSPRTGSTWLLRQICHPLRIDHRLPLGFALPEGSTDEIGAVPYDEFMISAHAAPKGGSPVRFGDLYLPTTLNAFGGDRSSYAFADRFADVWGPELRRLILVRLAATLDRASGAGMPLAASPALAIKEVSGSHGADVVMRLFPRSKLLFLIRDGRDVIDSLMHAQGPGGWMMRAGPRFHTAEERLAWVRDACVEWASTIDVVRSAFDRHPPELRLELRYEDLRTETLPALTAVLEWLGLPSNPERVEEIVAANSFERVPAEWRGATRLMRFAQPGLWRENLTDDEQELASEIMGSRLEALGYDPD
jgi:hypothetical protein